LLLKLTSILLQVTEEVLRQAYVEAVYRALGDEWEYERMTKRWWINLFAEVRVYAFVCMSMGV
jgi:hypothetical protein